MKIASEYTSEKKAGRLFGNDLNNHLRGTHSKYPISGPILLMFHMSRLSGIAPVQFKRRQAHLFVCISPTISAVNFIIFSLLNAAAFAGWLLDFIEPPETTIRIRSPVRTFVWTADLLVVMLNMSVAAYKAPRRIRKVIFSLDQVQKLKNELEIGPNKPSETQKKYAAIIIYFAIVIFLMGSDYYFFIAEITTLHRNVFIAAMYSSYFCAYIVMFVLEMQFISVSWEVYKFLSCLNDLLEQIQQITKQQDSNILLENNFIKPVHVNMISKMVDSMKSENKGSLGFKTLIGLKTLPETIRHLVLSYDQVYDMVRQLNNCFGPELLARMAACMLHLIITPYNLIGTLKTVDKDMSLLLMQAVWCSWHLFCTWAVVEPCYLTQFQMDRTSYLVSHLILESTDGLVQEELEKFSKSLLLNRVDYSPMGACTLTRSLVVSMVGSVATYLVIIIQFDIQ